MVKSVFRNGVLHSLLCAAVALLPLGLGWQQFAQQDGEKLGMGARPGVVLETAVKHLGVSNPGQPNSGAGFILTRNRSNSYTDTNQQRLPSATLIAGRQTLLAYGRLQLEGG